MSFIDNGNGNGFYMPVSPAYGSGNGGWGNGFGGVSVAPPFLLRGVNQNGT